MRTHARWAPGNVAAALADRDYLKERNGNNTHLRPVTWVSWHAAQAYCQARGARLPTTAEWEYLARADERERAAADKPAFRQRALELAANGRTGERANIRVRHPIARPPDRPFARVVM